MRRAVLGLIVTGCLVPFADATAAQERVLIPESAEPWDAGDGFKMRRKLRQAISGIACERNQKGDRVCLLVLDEAAEGRHVTLSKSGYALDMERVILRDTQDELDAEAAATDGTYFYIAGSHSATRKKCNSNPGSRFVIRIRRDPASGRATGARTETSALWTIMAAQEKLRDHVGEEKCLGTEPPPENAAKKGQRGVNVEGMAVRDGKLHFGFRGPAKDGAAPILSVNLAGLFPDQGAPASSPDPVVTSIKVGKQRGIRDLLSVKDGILILAGPDDDQGSREAGWVLLLWDGKPGASNIVEPKQLGRLSLDGIKRRSCDDDEIKPEALALVDEQDHGRIVVMSDGLCDGGPLVFKLEQ
jgi:hypothetical protein